MLAIVRLHDFAIVADDARPGCRFGLHCYPHERPLSGPSRPPAARKPRWTWRRGAGQMLATGSVLLLGGAMLASCAKRTAPAVFPADRISVEEAQDYLNGLREFHARFTASGTDGMADGVLWLDRPGRLRVQYDHPPKLLLVNHGTLLLEDQVTGATTTMPVAKTPLGILLADKIELSGAVTVVSVLHRPGGLEIGLVKTGAVADGSLSVGFDTNPLMLRTVTIRDRASDVETLTLHGLRRDITTNPDLYRFQPQSGPAS